MIYYNNMYHTKNEKTRKHSNMRPNLWKFYLDNHKFSHEEI